MSQEISRMYATAEAAQNAVAELAEDGFTDVFVVPPPGADAPVSPIAAEIALGRVLLSDARIYAEGVARGGTLVTVHAPFGKGRHATAILESHGTIPSGKPEPEAEKVWDEAAPFSSAMHMPLLLDDPAPASRVIGISPLAGSDCSFSGLIGLPLLTNPGDMPESRWGIPFLSRNPAPLSSLLGLPLLKEDKPKNW